MIGEWCLARLWSYSSEDGYDGIFLITKKTDDLYYFSKGLYHMGSGEIVEVSKPGTFMTDNLKIASKEEKAQWFLKFLSS